MQETDPAKRAEIYKQVQQILRDDVAYLPIFQYVFAEGTRGDLVGYTQNAFVPSNMWNVADWYLKQS